MPNTSSYTVSKDQLIYAMSSANAAVLEVASGSTVVFETCDCFEDQIQSADAVYDGLDWSRINPATGPVYVTDAEPGDVLALRIDQIALAGQAVMLTGPKLGVAGDRLKAAKIRVIPIADGFAILPDGIRIPLNPMIGVIGTAPAGAAISCGTPDAHGGNMDCKIITEGTTLYLPVNVPGGLLALGDLHAAMGDGEVSVCGMEIAGEVTLRITLIKAQDLPSGLPTPMAQTAAAFYTIASAKLLDDAANMAANQMVDFICAQTTMSIDDAVNLLSVAGNLQICQVVDPLKTCRYELPKTVANQLGLKL